MDPSTGLYSLVYQSFDNDFKNHLKANDLHLYEMSEEGKLVKKTHDGRVWIHTSTESAHLATLNAAKDIILSRIKSYAKQTPLNSLKITSEKSYEDENLDEITALFQFVKVVADQDADVDLYTDLITENDQIFEIAKISAKKNGAAIVDHLENFLLSRDERFEIAKIVVMKEGKSICKDLLQYGLSSDQTYKILCLAAEKSKLSLSNLIFETVRKSKVCFELIKIIAENDPEGVSKDISNFPLSDSQSYEIAKIVANKSGAIISKYIDLYNLKSYKQRFEIANIALSHIDEQPMVAKYIKQYKLDSALYFKLAEKGIHNDEFWKVITYFDFSTGEFARLLKIIPEKFAHNLNFFYWDRRFDILKFEAAIDPVFISEQMDKCDISNYFQRFEIAKIAFRNGECSEYIKNFKLEEYDRFFLAKTVAAKYAQDVSKNIEKFELDPDHLYEIARICFQNLSQYEFLDNFHLKPEEYYEILKNDKTENHFSFHILNSFQNSTLRFEMVKRLTFENPRNLCHVLAYYDLNPSEYLEILSMAAKKMSLNIHDLILHSIPNTNLRFEIVKIAALQDPEEIAQNIDRYHLFDHQNLQFAKTVAGLSGVIISKNIDRFGIKDQNDRFEIVKIAITEHPHEIEIITRLMYNYSFNNKERFQIAKMALQNKNIWKLVEYYHLTNREYAELLSLKGEQFASLLNLIPNPQSRFDILKEFIKRFPILLCEHLEDCNLSELEQYEIASIAFKTDYLSEIAKHVFETDQPKHRENFMTNPQQVFDLAKIVFLSGRYEDLHNIPLDEEQRFELAKILSYKHGGKVSINIAKFQIHDQKKRLEVMKIAALNDLESVIQNFENYEFTDLDVIQEATYFLVRIFFNSNKIKEIFQFEKKQIFDQFSELALLGEQDLTKNEIVRIAEKSPYFPIMKPIIDEICQQSEHTRKSLIQLLGSFLLKCKVQKIIPEDLQAGFPLIYDLFEFREPSYRMLLINQTVELFGNTKDIQSWLALFNLTENKPYTALMCLFLAPMLNKSNQLRMADMIKTRVFQNTQVRNPYIKKLKIISDEKGLSLEEKQKILNHLIEISPNAQVLLKKIETVAFLINLGEIETVKNIDPKQGLDALINHVLIKYLNIEFIENCSEKFLNTFGLFRDPTAIFRYAIALNSLDHKKNLYMNCLREYVTNVLEGTFQENRYTTYNNIHLSTIFKSEGGVKLKELWEKGVIYDDLLQGHFAKKENESVDCRDFFVTKILEENRLPKDLFPNLLAVLDNPSKQIKQKLQLEAELQDVKTNLSKEEKREYLKSKKIKSFELQIIKLMHPDQALTNLETEAKMEAILKTLKSIYRDSLESAPLIDDLEEIIERIKESAVPKLNSRYEGWIVQDTDDPCDLLLLGTEVSDSCQSIDKNPEVNKCLLSYLIDGKNRALVVKNREGKIVARCVIRLLWDTKLERPVLFQDVIYPKQLLDPVLKKALDEGAKRRAAALNLPLVSENQSDRLYPNPIHSLFGRAPSEYVDALSGEITESSWMIRNTFLVDSSG